MSWLCTKKRFAGAGQKCFRLGYQIGGNRPQVYKDAKGDFWRGKGTLKTQTESDQTRPGTQATTRRGRAMPRHALLLPCCPATLPQVDVDQHWI